MQRPRRTTEIVEETQQNYKRQSSRQRSTAAPSPLPSTAKKHTTRQSRIAVPTRSSSLDRGSNILPTNSASVGRSNSVSAALVAPTPQKTPLYKSPARSLLLTAEKYREGVRVAPQNDKRWVQDQLQRVSDYLRNEAARGAIPGFTPEFFNCRSGGLRQMSIKQFVGLVNYFLQFARGNRFAVSLNNHVTDMVNVLQKLKYPHQLNKSWLKTPNTQHSFGNVMLLFDFFMEFVPPQEDDEEAGERATFPFLPPGEYTASRLEDEYQRIPDIDFQSQMLSHAEEGFMLWDKQLDQEFQALQTKTCDLYCQKRCGVESLAEVDASIKVLQEQLGELEQNRPEVNKNDEQLCKSLKEELRNIQQKIQKLSENIKASEKEIKLMKKNLPVVQNNVKSAKKEIEALNAAIEKQICTVEERDALINEVMDTKQNLQSKERALQEMEDFNHHQQILRTRTRSQLREQIQKFNANVRQIAYSDLNTNYSADDLQMPFKITSKDLQRLLPMLGDLKERIKLLLKENKHDLQQIEQETAQITYEIEYSLNPAMNSNVRKLNAAKEQLKKYEEFIAKERCTMEGYEEELIHQYQELKLQLKVSEAEVATNKHQLQLLVEENENFMRSIEEIYYKHAKEREEFLDMYAATLETLNTELQDVTDIVNSNEMLVNSILEKSEK